jgi:hypothetical protein
LGFDLAKNVVNDTLHFALRVDTQKLSGDLLRAYARAELQALAAENPSGRPSARQKKEARGTARARLEAEAKDSRFTCALHEKMAALAGEITSGIRGLMSGLAPVVTGPRRSPPAGRALPLRGSK